MVFTRALLAAVGVASVIACGPTTFILSSGRTMAGTQARALLLSAEHDLQCPLKEIKDVSTEQSSAFEGCDYRAIYEIRPYGDANLIVLSTRLRISGRPYVKPGE